MDFDRDYLKRFLHDDLEAMGFGDEGAAEIVAALCEAVSEYLPALRSAVSAKQIVEVGFFAHALKGTFNNFSAAPFAMLTELFLSIETEGKGAGDQDTVSKLMAEVEIKMKDWVEE
ncbi:Hpt domain-containing protein [bacterium]|nr:Hpt domain-containing protein [bacterium]